MESKFRIAACIASFIAVAVAGPALAETPPALQPPMQSAQARDEFFAEKTVTLLIGFEVGGAFDVVARLISRHIGQKIPGAPSVVARNQPGAGSRTAAAVLYQRAPRDGTTMANLHSNLTQTQLLGMKGIAYDSKQFNYVGRLLPNTTILYTWHESDIKTFADLRTKPIVVAATAPTSEGVILTKMSADLFGTKATAIAGYAGTAAANLAIERREADGVIVYLDGFKDVLADARRDKKVNIVVQYNHTRHAELANVPTIYEAVKSDEQRQMVDFFVSPSVIGQYIALPPNVPADRVRTLRTAFDAMVKDAKFLDEAKKLSITVDPMSGEELQAVVQRASQAPAAIVERARKYYPADALEPMAPSQP